MSILKKTQIRPRLSLRWEFLTKMTKEEQDKWLDDHNTLEGQSQNLFEAIRQIQSENADLKDQIDKLENAVSDTLKRNGELTQQLAGRTVIEEGEIRKEMGVEAYHRANEKGMQVFDKMIWLSEVLSKKS